MATVKIIYRPSASGTSPGTLYFRLIHKRRIKQIHTGLHIFINEWDEVEEKIKANGIDSRAEYLKRAKKSLSDNRNKLNQIIRIFEKEKEDYGVEDIVEKYNSSDTITDFISYCHSEIAKCKERGQESCADHYQSTVNSFIRFYGDAVLPFPQIDSDLISRYEGAMKKDGLCLNTVSYYMRKLRALYNQAVEDGYTDDRQPFKHVYTGVAKTVKRAVSLGFVKALKNLNLVDRPLDAFARDIFLFSFYLRGMAPVDIAYLQKKDLQNGFVCYRRRKTSQLLKIKWTAEMNAIVLRYGDANSEYMLPLIKSSDKVVRRQYLSATHLINKHLKELGKEIGLAEPLTLYVARHTWASVALSNNVPIRVISQGMGHDSEKTTRIYLASLDTSTLDKANEGIIGLLNT